MKEHSISVKWKLTLWIMGMMLVMAGLTMTFFFSVSSRVAMDYTYRQLDAVVRRNLTGISREDGVLRFSDDFRFVENGVYTILYNDAGAYLAGQTPLSFPESVPFENGLSREVSAPAGDYCVLDLRLPMGWEDSIWVRGVIAAPDTIGVLSGLLHLAVLLLPLSVAISAAGAYLLSGAALRPIQRLIKTAEEIEEGSDLSRRMALPQGADEIGRLGRAFDSMLQRLERSFEREKQFTSDASHELRTPITIILAQCNDMLRQEEGANDREGLAVIQRQAQRMNDMVSQLLQMTRLEQGTQPIHFEQADMSGLVEALCEEQPFQRGIAIQTDIQPDIEAEFDVTLMSRLLQNLLNNASRYSKENGHIWVTLRKDGGEVLLSVRDDGIGIPAERLEHIWDRFYQGDDSRAQQGAGLGLTMVRQIARLHGGTVTADSIEHVGSCFTLRFPVSGSQENKI